MGRAESKSAKREVSRDYKVKVLLIDIDSKIENLALKKIEKYHLDKGDEVVWNFPLMPVDKTYVSCIFSWNADKCRECY